MSFWDDPLGSAESFFSQSTNPASGGRYVIGKVDPAIQKMEFLNEASAAMGGGDVFSKGFIESYGDVASTVGKAIALYYGGAYLKGTLGTAGAVGVGSTAINIYGNYQQAKAMEEQAAAQEAARKKQEAKEQAQYLASKRKQLREQRILQARTMQAAASRGVMGSSGILGSTGAATALFGGALAFQEGQTRYNMAISQDMQDVADARSDAEKWGFVAATASQIGSMASKIR